MKHKSNVGPGLIVALGSPADNAAKMERPFPTGKSESRDLDSYDDANTDTVPLNLLSMPDDQEQMQPPEVGDVVNYQVTGKVVAIEGNYAKVQRQSINGQELPSSQDSDAASEDANQDEDGDDAASLRSQAAGIGALS